jgi:hypothetical protein
MITKAYIEFSISGTLEVEEDKRELIMKEISKVVSKLLSNKHILKTDISVNSSDDESILQEMLLANYTIEA